MPLSAKTIWAACRGPAMAVLLIATVLLLAAPAAAGDPYGPLKVLDGRWLLTLANGQKLYLTNQCARLASAVTCERLVDGSPADLEIYLPVKDTPGAYRTLALDYAAQTPAPWSRLTINGAHWLYESSANENGHPLYRRTVNDFDGPNRIRFTQERSMDGKTWETVMTGEEARLR